MPAKLNPAASKLAGKRIGGGRYELVHILGQGAYGVVYLSLDTTSAPDRPTWYAIKCLSKTGLDQRQRKFQRREIALHQLASAHPGIVSLHCVIEEGDFMFVVLDFCADGDLFAMITEQQVYLGQDELVKSVFLQVVDAVEYCHDLGIYHRDLKPENILCKNGGANLMIADFGLATSEKVSDAFGCGSSFYMSPECQGGVYQKGVPYSTGANDIWALGVILVNLTCGRNPWKQATISDETFKAYVADPNFLRKILPLSGPTNELLKRVFALNPQQRITIQELREAIVNTTTFTMTEEELINAHSAVRKIAVQQQSPPSPPTKPRRVAPASKTFLVNGGTPVKIIQEDFTIDHDQTTSIAQPRRYPRTPGPHQQNFILSPSPAATSKMAGEDQRHPRQMGSPYTQHTNTVASTVSPYLRQQAHRSPNPNDGFLASSSSSSDESMVLTPEVQAVQEAALNVVPGGDLDGGDWENDVVGVNKAAAVTYPTKALGTPALTSTRGFLRDVVRKIRAL